MKKDRFSFGLFQGFSPEKNVDQKLSKVDVFVSEPQFFNDFNQFGRKKSAETQKWIFGLTVEFEGPWFNYQTFRANKRSRKTPD